MKTTTLYQKLASDTEGLIEKGTYRCGDKLPSVRVLAKQMGVSITTVTEAYRLLEDQGLVEARPQSGYYVVGRQSTLPTPPVLKPESAIEVEVGSLIRRVVSDMGKTDVQLGAASPDPALLPTKKLTRCLTSVARDSERLSCAYDPPPGFEGLRRQIAKRARLFGSFLAPEDIILTLGCQEALCLALRATCEVGQTVAVETPTFHGLLQAIEILGLKVVEIPSHPVTGMSMDALKLALEQMEISAILVTPNFSNPSGSLMPEVSRRELLDLAEEFDVPVVEDDVYGEIGFSEKRLRSLKALDNSGRVLHCSSFSKSLAPGYRVGWIIPGRYRAKVLHYKILSNLASPGLQAAAIAKFLEGGGYERHLKVLRRQCGRRVGEMARAILAQFPEGTAVSQPQGGFVLWVTLPNGLSSLDLNDRAVEKNVSVAPGPIFSASTDRYLNKIRLSATNWNEEAVSVLAKLVHSLVDELKQKTT